MSSTQTREQWLEALAQRSASVIARSIADGGDEHPTLRLSCGFPLTQGRKKSLAGILPPTVSDDFTAEIFISPEVDSPEAVARLLVPLLVVAHSGDYKQGARYRRALRHLGLADGVELPNWLTSRLNTLGAYPHAQVTVPVKPKQTTRLVRVICEPVGGHAPYIARMSNTTLSTFGAPICPACLTTMEVR
jgi:hypothetical protein